tara:strand:+ start:135 stop:872 length:738 start_codon:yes stop_codon:yes gene_type:complete
MLNNDSKLFEINIQNYSGSLYALLDLAKAQKVDLEKISITKLVDQFHHFIKNEKNINLELASEYLVIAAWLTYLKSKLLLPDSEEEEFKALEVAQKLKLQLKKLELIRLLSDQMLKRKRLGKDIFLRGGKGMFNSIYNNEYSLTLFEILKTYSNILTTKNFQKISIPKLPVFTTENGINIIKNLFGSIKDWKNIKELVPINFKKQKNMRRTGNAGIFAASLELVREGSISIKQTRLYDDIYIKEK